MLLQSPPKTPSKILLVLSLVFSLHHQTTEAPFFLEYDFYRSSCPQAEKIVRSLHKEQPDVAPALLRLVFHDCFIQGCDASVLLESIDGYQSEKDTPPNEMLKGFNAIEKIKSKIEQLCPATVSCSDILVLAAREATILAGGPYYPLPTGRRDSAVSFPQVASYELPSPNDDLSKTLTSFARRGFAGRETVSLLGAHSIGIIHCKFFINRVYNYTGTGEPDPTLDFGFLNTMRRRCSHRGNFSEEPGMDMDYKGATGREFGRHYYNSLVLGKGILRTDQQLMASEATESWVQTYASDISIFQRDFAQIFNERETVSLLGAHNSVFHHQTAATQLFLQYDFYRNSCPQAEKTVRSTIPLLYEEQPNVAPALLRLVFHDCFIQIYDSPESDLTLNGVVDFIGVFTFNPEWHPQENGSVALSNEAFENVVAHLPPNEEHARVNSSADGKLSLNLTGFTTKSLTVFGSQLNDVIQIRLPFTKSIPQVQSCFPKSRRLDFIFRFRFLNTMRKRCSNRGNLSEEPGMDMDYNGVTGPVFSRHYCNGLVLGKGILHADEQLMVRMEANDVDVALPANDADVAVAVVVLSCDIEPCKFKIYANEAANKTKKYYSHLTDTHHKSRICTKCRKVSADEKEARQHSKGGHTMGQQQTPQYFLKNHLY